MRRNFIWSPACCVAIVCLLPASAEAADYHAGASSDIHAQCAALAGVDYSGLQDAPTQIVSAKVVAALGRSPAFCQVEGYVAPQVGFELRLPLSDWNRKFLALGSGAFGGRYDGAACAPYLHGGYACMVFDTGHKGQGGDGIWALDNLPAQIDFGYRATHVSSIAGKAILTRFYAKGATKSFFVGCSAGGYEGMVEAQRFPWDFDGIVAGAPDMDELGYAIRALWGARNFSDNKGKPLFAAQDLQVLHSFALEQCDRDDGVVDGIISNPSFCKLELSRLLCVPGKTSKCLSQEQYRAAQRIYAGPTNAAGERISTGGVYPGSELYWNDEWMGLSVWPEGAKNLLRYMIYGVSPEWIAADFDFDRDYKRFGLGAIYTDTNPDLRKYKAAGGKLIVYQGGSDLLNLPSAIVDYYETAEKVMDGRKSTQEFFRLFVIPDMKHCSGGTGPYAIDYLHYIEQWVEQGLAPDAMIGAHVSDDYLANLPPSQWEAELPPRIVMTRELKIMGEWSQLSLPIDAAIPISFTRPIYPYPAFAKYKGFGDQNKAENFESAIP